MLTKTKLAALPACFMVLACGRPAPITSSTATAADHACGADPGAASTAPSAALGVYAGNAGGHALRAVTAKPGYGPEHASLIIDQDMRIDLTRIATVYCSDSIGLFADAATREAAHVIVSLNARAGGNTIQVQRLKLDQAAGVRLEGVLSQQRLPAGGADTNGLYTLRSIGTHRAYDVALPTPLGPVVTTALRRALVVEVDGNFVLMSTGGVTARPVLLALHVEPVPD